MDFLESLYSIENFGIYLFVIIGILVILFLVVLFFGKKDQKKRKELEEKLEQTKVSSRDAFAEVTPASSLEVPESKNEEVKPVHPVEVHEEQSSTVSEVAPTVLNSDLASSNTHEEIQKEEPKKEFDFDALADAISKELADMEKNMKDEEPVSDLPKVEPPVVKETVTPVHLNAVAPEMPKEVPPVQKPKPVMPSVFSSVYVNREKEEPKVQEPVSVSKPEIELPKKMDLPKKADSVNENVKPVLEEEKDDIIFR